jgi:hypothetical protein
LRCRIWIGGLVEDLADEEVVVLRLVGEPVAEHGVEHRAGGVEVDARVLIARARGLLRGHELRRAHHGAGAGEGVELLVVAQLGDAEVEHLHPPLVLVRC